MFDLPTLGDTSPRSPCREDPIAPPLTSQLAAPRPPFKAYHLNYMEIESKREDDEDKHEE